ncbi:hypothetical protein BGW80DRAFT_1453069 [Lactifluus volemus]|nr:hypothetical protein BGW80DRAFT_1453069 [Lactifluus volemus]
MSSSSSSFITTPLSLEPEPRGVTVRFDDECILIPDPQPRSRMSRLLLKIRRPSQEPSSPTSPHHCHVPPSPRPALSRKFSLNEDKRPVSPVRRRASLPPPSRTHVHHAHTHTHPSSPLPLVTIPLRPCCPDCFPATERAASEGNEWTENFTRAARRRRSISVDNRPCPPHLLPGGAATIQWSTVTEHHPPATFRSVLVVDEADHMATAADVASSTSPQEPGLEEALDHLSIQEPEDDVLQPLLTRQSRWLTPIPSNNSSADNLAPKVDILPSYRSSKSGSVSPPPSPLPQTPSSEYSTPLSSPTISSPSSQQSERGSPRIINSFRIPKGASLRRAGADILKGVSVWAVDRFDGVGTGACFPLLGLGFGLWSCKAGNASSSL